jgi:uncharacterized membrane protein
MWRRVLVRLRLVVLLAAGMFTFVACLSVGDDGSQREYVEDVSDARKQLFQGVLLTPVPRNSDSWRVNRRRNDG